MTNIFFGTDGWRALLDSEINEKNTAIVSQAFAEYVLELSGEGAKVAVAYDTRRGSAVFAGIIARTLKANGIEVLLASDVTPTPVLSYTVVDRGCFAGVMVTASHNPPEYNGIKFKAAYGGPFCQEQTRSVEEKLYASEPKVYDGEMETYDMLPAYCRHIEGLIRWDVIREAGLPVLVDSMGGAGGHIIERILKAHGCNATTIFGEPSETFHGRLAEPIARNLVPAGDEARKGGYALCVATDGDADRLGVVMDTGEFLSAQLTILLLVDYLKRVRRQPGGIVHTSSVTAKLREHFKSADTPIYDVQVGFKYITDVMVRETICFGGEESGGFGYGMHIPERDGVFSALLFCEMLACSGCRTISEYAAQRSKELGTIHYDRIDMPCHRADRVEILPRLYESRPSTIAGFMVEEIQHFYSSRGIVNGLKFVLEGDCRWLLMRASETEPLLRFYAEGQTDGEVRTLLETGVEITGNKI